MSLVAFLIAAVVLAITPGPGIAYVVARTVAGGRSEGLARASAPALAGCCMCWRRRSAYRCWWLSRPWRLAC